MPYRKLDRTELLDEDGTAAATATALAETCPLALWLTSVVLASRGRSSAGLEAGSGDHLSAGVTSCSWTQVWAGWRAHLGTANWMRWLCSRIFISVLVSYSQGFLRATPSGSPWATTQPGSFKMASYGTGSRLLLPSASPAHGHKRLRARRGGGAAAGWGDACVSVLTVQNSEDLLHHLPQDEDVGLWVRRGAALPVLAVLAGLAEVALLVFGMSVCRGDVLQARDSWKRKMIIQMSQNNPESLRSSWNSLAAVPQTATGGKRTQSIPVGSTGVRRGPIKPVC